MQDAAGYREYYQRNVDPNITDDDIIARFQVDWEDDFDSLELSAVRCGFHRLYMHAISYGRALGSSEGRRRVRSLHRHSEDTMG